MSTARRLLTTSLLAALAQTAPAGEPVQPLPATCSWIGNTFPGAAKWVQQNVKAMVVVPDGTIYTNVFWDEAGREVGVYKDGDAIGIARHTHGWGYNGGEAIAVNAKYVFIAQTADNEGGGLKDPDTWPPKGLKWHGISRRLRSDIAQGAPFPGGKGGKGDTLKGCFLPVNEAPADEPAALAGLWADDRRVYVANPWKKRIEVLDAETLAPVAQWEVERAGPLAGDPAGRLWMLQRASGEMPAAVVAFSADGKPLPQRVTLPADARPTGFCIDPKGRLLVADAGPSQQVLVYEGLDTAPRPAAPLGAKGGIFSGIPGRTGDLRFNDPVAVGGDAAGHVVVVSNGNSGGGGNVMECYDPAGKLRWRIFGIMFVDVADLDPADETAVFTKEERIRIDPAKPAGKNWSYEAYTINRFKYPDDPRLHIWSAGAWVRRLQGKRILFVLDMNNEFLQVYRFNEATDGEIAIPAGLFAGKPIQPRRRGGDPAWPPHQPAKGEWIWCDADGDGAFDAGEYDRRGDENAPGYQGWWVDDAGTVWQATETKGLRRFPLKSIDAKGVPAWGFAAMETLPHPAELKQLKRVRYLPGKDVMLLGGCTDEHKNQHWKPMGPVIVRYDDWSKPSRKARWTLVAPYAKGSRGHESCEPMGFDVAGDFVFVPYTGASKETGFSTGHIEIFRLDDAKPVGCLEPPPEIGEIGLQDVRECLRAHKRSNGEYVVFLEEDWKAKILMYRWKP